MPDFRVAVTGGRDYGDRNRLFGWLDRLFAPTYGESVDAQPWWMPRPDLFMKVGDASGVDQLVTDWMIVNWVRGKVYAADWGAHGRAAGPIRNGVMLADGGTDLLVAFPGGRGTADCVRQARKLRIAVLEIP